MTCWGRPFAERVPKEWREQYRNLKHQLEAGDRQAPPRADWELLADLLTEREWSILAEQILWWDDLQPEQQAAYAQAAWDEFVWKIGQPLPLSLKKLVNGDGYAGLPLGSEFTLHWLEIKKERPVLEESRVLEARFSRGGRVRYHVPVGLQIEFLRLLHEARVSVVQGSALD